MDTLCRPHTAVLRNSQSTQRVSTTPGAIEPQIITNHGNELNLVFPTVAIKHLNLHPTDKHLTHSIIQTTPPPRQRLAERRSYSNITPVPTTALTPPIRTDHRARQIPRHTDAQHTPKTVNHQLLIQSEANHPTHHLETKAINQRRQIDRPIINSHQCALTFIASTASLHSFVSHHDAIFPHKTTDHFLTDNNDTFPSQ